jgi:hypothetical protein
VATITGSSNFDVSAGAGTLTGSSTFTVAAVATGTTLTGSSTFDVAPVAQVGRIIAGVATPVNLGKLVSGTIVKIST